MKGRRMDSDALSFEKEIAKKLNIVGKARCEMCYYSRTSKILYEPDALECRKCSPQASSSIRWPIVYLSEWCGSYQLDFEKLEEMANRLSESK
jgi:hypothetical protein